MPSNNPHLGEPVLLCRLQQGDYRLEIAVTRLTPSAYASLEGELKEAQAHVDGLFQDLLIAIVSVGHAATDRVVLRREVFLATERALEWSADARSNYEHVGWAEVTDIHED